MIIFLFSSVLCCAFFAATFSDLTPKNNTCGSLYLTQSPYKKKNIQLNWSFNCTDLPDTILLTSSDLNKNSSASTLHKISPYSVTRGFQESSISIKDVKLPGNWEENEDHPNLEAKCFDYYIASIKANKVVFSDCFSIQPAWMSHFGDLRIGDMMIPGTHNSGAYVTLLPLAGKFALTQDKTFWQQLVYGIRYFDIRIGRYGKSTQNIYINHDFVPCTKLLPELESAANFLKKSPKEVIILNFHRFPFPKTFTKDYHLEVINLIKSVFGDMIFPFNNVSHSKGPQLKDFWAIGKRVIISYASDDMVKENSLLWPSVTRFWGDKQKLEDLESYVKDVLSKPISGNPMHVLMAQLTPTFLRNLKDLAVQVNRELLDWVEAKNLVNNVNIIASDFFTGNDMINVAIETNLQKLK